MAGAKSCGPAVSGMGTPVTWMPYFSRTGLVSRLYAACPAALSE